MTVAAIIAIIQADKVLKRLREKILSNRGTFRDTFEYSNRAAELLGANFSESVLAMSLDDRVSACVELLRDRYDDIMPLLDAVQKRADLKNKLTIAPKHPPFNAERAEQIGTSLRDLSVSDERIQRRARSAPATATRAIHDDYIEANVELRSSAGIKCYISRVTDGNCCDWCTRVAGRYEYGTEPEGIFHRHDNCGCSVTYENGRQRQNVWTKKTWEVPAEDAGTPEPVRLTKEQAAVAGAPPPKVFSVGEARELNDVKVKENTAKPEERKELLSRDKVDIADNAKTVEKVSNALIDKSAKTEYNMFRKKHNTGAFEELPEPMQQRHIESVLKVLGIDSDGIEFDIICDEEMMGKGYYGYTFPNGKKVQLYPDAFSSREELVKTLGHERIHCNQIHLFGEAKTIDELREYERAAKFSEDYWWSIYKERTGYYESK